MPSYKYEFPVKLTGGTEDATARIIIVSDPKREGMYKSSISYSNDDYGYSWSHLYGKCNQSEIQKLISKATEI
jgi:hypothetical protein